MKIILGYPRTTTAGFTVTIRSVKKSIYLTQNESNEIGQLNLEYNPDIPPWGYISVIYFYAQYASFWELYRLMESSVGFSRLSGQTKSEN